MTDQNNDPKLPPPSFDATRSSGEDDPLLRDKAVDGASSGPVETAQEVILPDTEAKPSEDQIGNHKDAAEDAPAPLTAKTHPVVLLEDGQYSESDTQTAPASAGLRTPKQEIRTEKVSAEEVLSSAGVAGTSSVKPGTYTQRAGLRLAAGVGALATLVTLAIVIRTLWSLPAPAHLDGQMTEQQLTALMTAQKANYDNVLNSATNLFDSIIVKALLPVFTSILGYIFGARSSSETDPQG